MWKEEARNGHQQAHRADGFYFGGGGAQTLGSDGRCGESSNDLVQSVTGSKQQPGGQWGFPRTPFLLVFLPICVSFKHNPLILLEIGISYLMPFNKSLLVQIHGN